MWIIGDWKRKIREDSFRNNFPKNALRPEETERLDATMEEEYARMQGCENPRVCRSMHRVKLLGGKTQQYLPHTEIQWNIRSLKGTKARYEKVAKHHELFHPDCQQ